MGNTTQVQKQDKVRQPDIDPGPKKAGNITRGAKSSSSFLLNGVTPIHTIHGSGGSGGSGSQVISSSRPHSSTVLELKRNAAHNTLNNNNNSKMLQIKKCSNTPEGGLGTTKIFGSTFHIVQHKTREEYFKEKEPTSEEEEDYDTAEESEGEEEFEGADGIRLMDLPDLVLDHILSFLRPHHLLTIRLVNHRLKSFVDRIPHLPRVKVRVHSFPALKYFAHNPQIPWIHFRLEDGIREFAGPVSVSNTPQWDHEFSRFLNRCGPFITSLTSDMLLTFSEVDRILSSLRNLEKFSCAGYLYSIEHIMNTRRTLDKYENVMLKRDEGVVLEKLTWLKLEGCTTLGNILVRAPNLRYICVTSGIGANNAVQPSGWRDIHFTKSIADALKAYVKERFPYRCRKPPGVQLVIDFGEEKTNRLIFDDEAVLEDLCTVCFYASATIELRNVRSKWLPKITEQSPLKGQTIAIRKSFSECYNSIKSVYVESNMLNKLQPQMVQSYSFGLTLRPWFPIPFELPQEKVTDIKIYDVHEDVRKEEIEQVLTPRPQLRRLSLTNDSNNPLVEEVLDFSHFPNLTYLSLGKAPTTPKDFWLLCKHLKKLESLNLKDINEKVLTVKSAGDTEAAITKLKDLKQLVIKKYRGSEKSWRVLRELKLETLHLPTTKISLSGLSTLFSSDGKIGWFLESFEFQFDSKSNEDITAMESIVRKNCPNLRRLCYRK